VSPREEEFLAGKIYILIKYKPWAAALLQSNQAHPSFEDASLTILQIALPVPLRRVFDYLSLPDVDLTQLKPGVRILVPFQRRKLVGIFMGLAGHSEIDPKRLKPIIEVLDQSPLLPPEMMKLCTWAADYYHYPLGEVLQAALPLTLRQGKSAEVKPKKKAEKNPHPPALAKVS